jgi:Putative adhesin
MMISRMKARYAGLAALLLAAPLLAAPSVAATRKIDQHQAADANGTVEIQNISGSVQVAGWDKPEVSVTGHIGDQVERVDLTGDGHRTVVHVVLPSGSHWGGDGSAELVVHVPKASALEVSLVSADLDISGVSGPQEMRSVSGTIQSSGGSVARVNTVSGDVQVSVANGAGAEVETVSGDVNVEGAGGDVSVQTVSGGGKLTLGSIYKFRLRTVSGDFTISTGLGAGADVDADSVSGDLKLALKDLAGAEFDLRTLSGDIDSCGGPEVVRAKYGPGSRLTYSTGDAKARVHLSSKSGDLSLCAK